MRDVVKSTSALIIAVVLATSQILGCVSTEVKPTAPPIANSVRYVGNIVEVSGDTLKVFAFDGYRGMIVVRLSDETAIDPALKAKLKIGNQITFLTNGTMTRSEPPQATATAVKSVLEGILYRGRVAEVRDGAILVSTTYPRTDSIVARLNGNTVISQGVNASFQVGNAIEFETNGLIQPSEPAQVQMMRLVKNQQFGSTLIDASEYTGTVDRISANNIRIKMREGMRTLSIASPQTVAGIGVGDRVVALAVPVKGGQKTERIVGLPADAAVFGHFGTLGAADQKRFTLLLIGGAALQVERDGGNVPAGLEPDALVYLEYRVDRVAEVVILRRLDLVTAAGGSQNLPLRIDRGAALAAFNATYVIGNQPVTLSNGVSEVPAAPGSASTTKTTVFGKPVVGVIDEKGHTGAALLLVQSGAGTGTFYYVAACVRDDRTGLYAGTNAVLLGDRVAPQNVQIAPGSIIANYADRRKDEPMTARPSVGVSKYLKIDGTTLKAIAK